MIGGQALIEGVLMRSPQRIGTAVRLPNGKIKVQSRQFKSATMRNWFLGLPIIRGFVVLYEMLVLGTKALTWSAAQHDPEVELTRRELTITMLFSILLVIALFVVAPYYLTKLVVAEHGVTFNLVDGVFRLLVFLAYVWGIGLLPDVHRMFQYHAAEHMSVHCYEARLQLKPKNVATFPAPHPRCGTALVVVVIALSIVLFSLIKSPLWYINIGWRIVLIPVISGFSYELIRLAGHYRKSWFFKALAAPGLWTQVLTTRQPNKKQIEVAIAALKAAIR